MSAGYTATRLMQDEGFERGFYIAKYDQTKNFLNHGTFRDYCTTNDMPAWGIAPWWVGYDLYENRDKTTDKYTLKDDKEISTIIYNPEEKSVSMRLDATKVLGGMTFEQYGASGGKWWPHLLIEQTTGLAPVDRKRNSAAADKMFVEIDIKVNQFKTCIARIDWERHLIDVNHRFEIKSIEHKGKFTRYHNHIIAYFDRCSVYGRIKNDDPSVINYLSNFTLAQIMEFIKFANENDCINVKAMLMNYKNERFGTTDVMDDFVL
jgi:hypothetical protein